MTASKKGGDAGKAKPADTDTSPADTEGTPEPTEADLESMRIAAKNAQG
jgi:hypothetical protein